MRSIDKVLEQYDGNKEWYIENNEFGIFIIIPVEKILRDKRIELGDIK